MLDFCARILTQAECAACIPSVLRSSRVDVCPPQMAQADRHSNAQDAANPPLQADTEDAKENRKPGQQASKKRRAAADKGTDSGVLKSAHKDLKQKGGFSRAGKGGKQREPLQESSLEHQIQEKTSPANEDETVQHSVKVTDRTEELKASKQEAQITQ